MIFHPTYPRQRVGIKKPAFVDIFKVPQPPFDKSARTAVAIVLIPGDNPAAIHLHGQSVRKSISALKLHLIAIPSHREIALSLGLDHGNVLRVRHIEFGRAARQERSGRCDQ